MAQAEKVKLTSFQFVMPYQAVKRENFRYGEKGVPWRATRSSRLFFDRQRLVTLPTSPFQLLAVVLPETIRNIEKKLLRPRAESLT